MTKQKGGRRVLKVLLILVLAAVICYLGIIGMIVWKENHLPPMENYDTIVVLGAQVKEDGSLSLQLEWRLEAALEAYQAHPVPVICCGGQGANEPEAEGTVMRAWMIEHGVPEDMVTADTVSVNTRQNLRQAIALMGRSDITVCIVTSDYHLPRALAMAADEGLKACGKAAATKPEYWIKNYAREALSWCKYWAEKYLHIQL